MIEPQNQPAVHFYTLNDCLTFRNNAINRRSPDLKLNKILKIFRGRFGRLAAAYCLAFCSYDLLVSSDSDFIF